MNWGILKDGNCPKCANILILKSIDEINHIMKCGVCEFKISLGKYNDLCKGKQSSIYKEKKKKYKSIDRYNDKLKTKAILASEAQRIERESNLRRMIAKGLLNPELL